MNRKRIVPWWESLGVGAPAPADAQPDPADLGTAFGLDASFATTAGAFDGDDDDAAARDDVERVRFSRRSPRPD